VYRLVSNAEGGSSGAVGNVCVIRLCVLWREPEDQQTRLNFHPLGKPSILGMAVARKFFVLKLLGEGATIPARTYRVLSSCSAKF